MKELLSPARVLELELEIIAVVTQILGIHVAALVVQHIKVKTLQERLALRAIIENLISRGILERRAASDLYFVDTQSERGV